MVLEEMQRNGVPTTCFTFTALIDACAKGGQLDRAFHVLGMMKASTAAMKVAILEQMRMFGW